MVAEWLGPVLLVFLGSLAAAGCVAGDQGTVEGRDGERGAVATSEETSTPEGDPPAAGRTREPFGLHAESLSPGHAYLPAGFGEGSLWATDLFVCNDTGSVSASASSAASSSAACALPPNTLLRRLDPRTGEEEATITLEGFSANIMEVAFGAGSVWVSSGDYYPEPVGERGPGDIVLRVDPETNRVVGRIPVDSPTGLTFGHGSVWATSAGHGTVSRIDPETGEVAAEIDVGRGAVDIATDERTGDVWVAGLYLPEDYSGDFSQEDSEYNKLSRVDPATNRVVAEIPIAANSPEGGAQSVAVGEGAVWTQSVDGGLFKVDPATNEVTTTVDLGDYSSHLAAYGGAIWATVQDSSATRLQRADPRTGRVVASEHVGSVSKVGYGRLVAGGGYLWFVSSAGETGKGTLTRVEP